MHSKLVISLAFTGLLLSFPALGDTADELQTRLVHLKETIQTMRQKQTEKSIELEKLDDQLNDLQIILNRNTNKNIPDSELDKKSNN